MSSNHLQPPTLKTRSYSTNSTNRSAESNTNTPQSPLITIDISTNHTIDETSKTTLQINTTQPPLIGNNNTHFSSSSSPSNVMNPTIGMPNSARTGHRRMPSSFLLPSSNNNNNTNHHHHHTPQSPSHGNSGGSSAMMYHFNTSSNSLTNNNTPTTPILGLGGGGSTPKTPNSPTSASSNVSARSVFLSSGGTVAGGGNAGVVAFQHAHQPPLIPPVSFHAIFQQENNKMIGSVAGSSIEGMEGSNNNYGSAGAAATASTSNMNSSSSATFQNPISNSVEYYHAHMAMFIKKKFEEEEEYLMYSYPNEISSPNIHIRSLKELRGTLHSVFGECHDILSEEVRFCYLTPTGRSVSSLWWNAQNQSSSSTVTASGMTGNVNDLASPNQSVPPPSSASSSVPSVGVGGVGGVGGATDQTQSQHTPVNSISSTGNNTDTVSMGTVTQKASLLEFLQESKKLETAELSNVIQLRETIEKNKRPLIVTYKLLKQYIFLLYLPIPTDYNYGNVMKSVYEQYVNELFEFLDFIYQDVEEIITNISEYQSQLDTIFNRFFEMVFHDRDFSFVNSFKDGFVKFQPSFHISQTMDAELSNLETIMKEDCFNIGTCLIYKGLLQLSHLPKNITKQVIRYLTHFNIIHRAQDSPEMVIIEKVFIKENSNPFDLLTINETSGDNGYDYLLSVITQGEKVMCSVLYAKRYPQSYYEGDLYYVDEMRTCLLQLEKKGIFTQLRGQFKTSHSLANIFTLPTVSVTANTESSRDSTSGLVGLGSFTSNSFYGFGLTNDNHTSPTPSSNTSSSNTNSGSDTVVGSNMKHFVTQGSYNVLLGYVVHSNSNGVILYHNSSNPAIASVFSLKCQVVRQVLQSKRSMSDDPIVEFGIHIDQKVPMPNNTIGHIGYWICGRMNDMSDEFYVCYEDSIPQDVVELSYRLYSRLYI